MLRVNASLARVAHCAVVKANHKRKALEEAWKVQRENRNISKTWEITHAVTHAWDAWVEWADIAHHIARHTGIEGPKEYLT